MQGTPRRINRPKIRILMPPCLCCWTKSDHAVLYNTRQLRRCDEWHGVYGRKRFAIDARHVHDRHSGSVSRLRDDAALLVRDGALLSYGVPRSCVFLES